MGHGYVNGSPNFCQLHTNSSYRPSRRDGLVIILPFPTMSAALLAGGASRRMGTDKARMPFAGGTLGGNAAQLLTTLFDDVLVVERADNLRTDWPSQIRRVRDPLDAPRASLTGITTALLHARHPWVFVMACDMPFANRGLISGLCNTALSGNPGLRLVVPEAEGVVHPLHAVYHRSLLADLRGAISRGEMRVQAFAKHHGTLVSDSTLKQWDPTLDGLANVNTQEEFNHAQHHKDPE